MKINIKDKKEKKPYVAKLKDVVTHTNGKVGLIYDIGINKTAVKVIVMSAFEEEEGTFDHSHVVQTWDVPSLSLFDGTITLTN